MSIAPGNYRTRGDDVDEVAVQRAVAGDEIRLTPREGQLAVAALHTRGLNDRQIAERLHISRKTVQRIRGRLGLDANAGGLRTRLKEQMR